jgi:hypothetical protein
MAGLNPQDARIFRITHRDNVPWLLEHGLHCKNSLTQDPNFVSIGSVELIDKRSSCSVPLVPNGTLADYVPFYFTPYSIMMYNIHTGYQGVIKRPNEEIVILTCSIHRLAELKIPFVFYDGHAYMIESTCYNTVADLEKIDWKLLQNRDFKNDPEDPGKKGRYQAEALVYRYLPASALLGIGCYNQEQSDNIAATVTAQGLTLPVRAVPTWYF